MSIPPQGAGRAHSQAWVVLSVLLIVLAPSQVWGGVPFWTAPISSAGQSLLTAMAYLLLVAMLGFGHRRSAAARMGLGLAAAGLVYGAVAWFVLHGRIDLAYSRQQFAVAAGLGTALALVPYVAPTTRGLLRLGLLGAGVAGLLAAGLRPMPTIVATALQPISIRTFSNLLGPVSMHRGGAIQRFGESFVLVTGDGAFYLLSWDRATGDLTSRPMPLRLPPDPGLPASDEALLSQREMAAHRVTGMVIDSSAATPSAFVAYQEWNVRGRCFTVRVASAELPGANAPAPSSAAWTPVFETSPCLPPSPGLDYLESGGRLAWFGEQLLLTVGDFGLTTPPLAQADDNSYGKVWLLDRAGNHRIFTRGHRNPQGLLVDRDRNVWLTEHGPQGGDELNLLEDGENYGWPLVTYGTDYRRPVGPLPFGTHDHGPFTEPVDAFVPSIGISDLITVHSGMFPLWTGDLLIGSLTGRSLFRARLRDHRVVYVEAIPIGMHIRDLAEGADGRIVLWTQCSTPPSVACPVPPLVALSAPAD